MPHPRNSLFTFAKYPEPGKVKTRLAADIGEQTACDFYRWMLEKIVHQTGGSENWSSYLYHAATHAEGESYFENLIDKFAYDQLDAQPDGDLTEKLKARFSSSMILIGPSLPMGGGKNGEEYRRIFKYRGVAIGSDCPHVTQNLLNQAFTTLESTDVVIGPSTDGGYYLIGLSVLEFGIFDEIDWSTEYVLDQTLERCKTLGLGVKTLPALSDIDLLADLETWPEGRKWLEAYQKSNK
jgi:glycosyltransferase A (GT-A) superfamily protein (DUF2064 family)